MPVEIRELVIRASIPDQPSGGSTSHSQPDVVQRTPDETERVAAAPKLTPDLLQSIVELCLAKLQEQQRDRSFR